MLVVAVAAAFAIIVFMGLPISILVVGHFYFLSGF
jgi:hypothetical protein